MEQVIQALISGILSGGIYALISVGLALIFGVVGLVNFAHGEFLMLSMYIAYWVYYFIKLEPYESLLINLVLMATVGYIVYKVIMTRVLEADHSMQMLLTLGLSMVLQNLALMLFKADYRNVRIDITTDVINIGFTNLSTARVLAFIVAIGASVALYLFLQKTYTGVAMKAVAQDGKAAKLMGINIKKIYGQAFIIGTMLVGLAGVLMSPMYSVFPTIGANFSTLAFIVVVLGGLSSIPGAIFGGILIGIVESMAGYLLGPAYQQAAYFLLFILVLIFKPSGIFGRE
ncbi:MAG: branched-chain amino acid ABC transporter permease [Eubacteriales bacterium]|nr:branched-chain amino acid ABC transporter permease [Eubacteriales bacterium]MDD4390631.1 branched-chain amino acid ABC transporter permease [Eubacteriales bacterium]